MRCVIKELAEIRAVLLTKTHALGLPVVPLTGFLGLMILRLQIMNCTFPTTMTRSRRRRRSTKERKYQTNPNESGEFHTVPIMMKQEEKNFLVSIGEKYGCNGISTLNRAIADGELVVLNFPDEDLLYLKSKYEGFDNLITALKNGSLRLEHSSTPYQNPIPQQNTQYTRTDNVKISLHTPDQELTLRGIAMHLGFITPKGVNTGDGSITFLNRYLAHGFLTLLTKQQWQSLSAIALIHQLSPESLLRQLLNSIDQ